MTDYSQPHEVSDLMMAFPANLGELLPPMSVIPDDYPDKDTWLRFQYDWFHDGLPATVEFYPKRGVDPEKGYRHLRTIQGSFEPKHQHKEAAVAWLASLWFDKVVRP